MLKLTSSAFAHGGEIPSIHTCEGKDVSPPLRWDDIPPLAESLVLLMDDPDAPGTGWDHWVLYNLPPDSSGLPEGVASGELPTGTREGVNSWGRTGYGGPCPPSGRHRYFFRLYALNSVLAGPANPTARQLAEAMEERVLAVAELVGTYRRSG